jgi:hypothetical protein
MAKCAEQLGGWRKRQKKKKKGLSNLFCREIQTSLKVQ